MRKVMLGLWLISIVSVCMAQNDKKSANQWSINDLRKEAGALSPSETPALRTCASGGEARSQFLLGLAYEFGHGGVTKDLQQAFPGPNSLVIREDKFPHLVALRLTPIQQSTTQTPIRLQVPAGFELTLPAGWEWQEMERDRLKLRIRGASDNQDQALVEIWIRRGKDDRGEFEGRATFRNLTWQTRTIDGRSVLWINNSEPGEALWGVIREGDAGVWVFLKHGAAPFARESAEQVFFSLAHAIRFLPASTKVSHPSTGATVEFPAAILPGHPVSWLNTPRDWELHIRSTDSGVPTIDLEWSSTYKDSVSINVYPAVSSIKDVEAALADITRFFQSKGIHHGPPQSLSIEGGKALWAEAPGTERPWVGAVERGGRIYFVNFHKKWGKTDGSEYRGSFLTVLRSVRPGTQSAGNDQKIPNQWNNDDLLKEAKALSPSDIPALRASAYGGEPRSQFLLGLAYEFGYGGITKDLTQALRLFKQAAEQGVGVAQMWVGDFYYRGLGVPGDLGEALGWWRRSYDSGYKLVSARIGYVYLNGMGVTRNYTEARRWFQLAANAGDPTGQKNMAILEPNCSTQFCMDLQTLIIHRNAGFQFFRGEKLDERAGADEFAIYDRFLTKRWVGKILLGRFGTCITESTEHISGSTIDTDAYYSCTKEGLNKAEADSLFDQIVADIRAAFPANAAFTYCGTEGCRSTPTSNRFMFNAGYRGDTSIRVGNSRISGYGEPARFAISLTLKNKSF